MVHVSLVLLVAVGFTDGAGWKPIPSSVGPMARAEALARKLKLNVDSPTTRQVLNSLDDKVGDFVAKYRRGSIQRELPWDEIKDMTLERRCSIVIRYGND
ncbi:hypothetical protein [Polyangium sp. y55x31]|uniref:hypothetical protein n=1 Tax=Polyangium sp. y55x31 TaxID=3042688 RepID=UPI002482E841|nr:hypothetical protein [Polyangium sp. y55x31]MDI1479205.1 hypothetical protein [Polyangium sp. y55x31]